MSNKDIKTQVEKILGSFLILDEMQPEDWKWYNQATTQILKLINEARVEELAEARKDIASAGVVGTPLVDALHTAVFDDSTKNLVYEKMIVGYLDDRIKELKEENG